MKIPVQRIYRKRSGEICGMACSVELGEHYLEHAYGGIVYR